MARFKLHDRRQGVAVIALLALLTAAAPAAAQQREVDFAIPAQKLSDALLAYGQQAGVAIAAPDELVSNRTAPQVRGHRTQRDALAALLQGTGLVFEFVSPTSVRVFAREQRSQAPVAVPVRAAANEPPPEEMVVTGTRIRGVAPIGSEVLKLDRQAIDRLGVSTTQEVLRTLSQFSDLGASDTHQRGGQNSLNNTAFGAGVNLRGLGTESTLVLVNGRRAAPAGLTGAFVDISMIPASAIQRIEIVPDGGSALYGSDAVGGVVNIILNRHADAARATTRYGFADGMHERLASGTAGASWTGGDLTASLEWFDRTALAGTARDYWTFDLRPYGGPDMRSSYGNPGTLTVNGVRYAIPAGQNGRNLNPALLVPGTQAHADYVREGDIQPNQRRLSGALALTQHLFDDSVTVSADLLASHRHSVFTTGVVAAFLSVPRSNPWFVSPVPGASSVSVNYDFARDFGPGLQVATADMVNAGTSIEARIGGGWTAQLDVAHSFDRERATQERSIRYGDALSLALADPNPATAFNPFGDGANSPAATVAFLNGFNFYGNSASVTAVGLRADGPLPDILGITPRVSVGTEYRYERFNVDQVSNTATLDTVTSPPTREGRWVQAVYGEVLLPVIEPARAVPLVQRLAFSAAARGERYSDFGYSFNPKAGVTWDVGAGLQFNAAYGRSFRAPQLSDRVEAANSVSISNFTDPRSPTGTTQALVLAGGYAGLKPQIAKTLSAGVVWEPRFAPGLHLGATYFDIDYRDRIQSLSGSALVNVLFNESVYGGIITRSPSPAQIAAGLAAGQLLGVPPGGPIGVIIDSRAHNYGVARVRGIDFDANYTTRVGPGELTTAVTATFLGEYAQGAAAGLPTTNFVGTIGSPTRWRGRGELRYAMESGEAGLAVNYVGSYSNTGLLPAQHVSSWTTLDLNAAVPLRRLLPVGLDATLSLTVRNLLDRDPPRVANVGTFAGYDGEKADPLGRFTALQLQVRW